MGERGVIGAIFGLCVWWRGGVISVPFALKIEALS